MCDRRDMCEICEMRKGCMCIVLRHNQSGDLAFVWICKSCAKACDWTLNLLFRHDDLKFMVTGSKPNTAHRQTE